MGAPGTARWIAAQKAARIRLRNEAIARALRRFVIGAALLLILLSLAPVAFAGDAAPACATIAGALHGPSLVFAAVVFGTGGLILGALLAVYRMAGSLE